MQHILEQHDKGSNQTTDAYACECDGEQQDDCSSGQIEEYKCEHELPERCHRGDKSNQPIDNSSEYERGNNAQGKNVEQNLYKRASGNEAQLVRQPRTFDEK